MRLTAHTVLTMEGPIYTPGYIDVNQGVITDVGPLAAGDNIEYPDFLLMPGFVNAHCHLELTSLGPIRPEKPELKQPFVPWIRKLIEQKRQLSLEEQKRGMEEGIQNLMHSGVTTLGDHISHDCPTEIHAASPLKGRLFAEVLGTQPEVSEKIYADLKMMRDAWDEQASHFSFHIVPHSIHGVYPGIFSQIQNNEHPPLSTHIAESDDEDEYFSKKGGPLWKLIRERGVQPQHQNRSALNYLIEENFDLSKFLFIHANYFTDDEITSIANHNVSVVHCPGSHAFFNHKEFPLLALENSNINIALGTDSLASNTQLNFLHEIQLLKNAFKHLSFEKILHMATINGAKALKMDKTVGSIKTGKSADIIAFEMKNRKTYPFEVPFLAEYASHSWINGQKIF